MIYVLNSPILTDWGTYSFKEITGSEARRLLSGSFVSAIGHTATAMFMSNVLDMVIPVNRIAIKMEEGDMAIVFRILDRLPEGSVLTQEQMRETKYSLGLLEMEKWDE